MAATKVIVLGGGHNGLVTAFYLAKAGVKPLVLERRETVGGATLTQEFHPGFHCSTLAHNAGPLLPQIAADMQLEKLGVRWLHPEVQVFSPAPDGRSLLLCQDARRSALAISSLSPKDAESYLRFHEVLARIAAALESLLTTAPPSLEAPSAADTWKLLSTGLRARRLGKTDLYRLLRWGPMAIADLVGEWFESELLRATIAARGIFGAALGPWSAGSTALYLLRALSDPHPAGGAHFVQGGLGALTQAMAVAAKQAGAEIRTNAEIARIKVKNDSVTGVTLAGGEEISATAVVSSADPKRTFLKLVDPIHLDPSFVTRMVNYRCLGNVAKLNLALSGLPDFIALHHSDHTPESALAGRIHIGPEIDYLERAFDSSKYGQFSPHPHLDLVIPSLTDPSLAPAGKHVMSVYVQFAPFHLRDTDWNAQRDALTSTVVNTLAEYAPNLPGLIVARETITPLDFEQKYGLTGGHIFHGELTLDQMFTMRPALEWARYRSPIRGLYLCGAGTHPGNGVNGASGMNAAREILKELIRELRK